MRIIIKPTKVGKPLAQVLARGSDLVDPSGLPIRSLKNPTHKALSEYCKNSDYKSLRGIKHGEDVHWWPSEQLTHYDAGHQLGMVGRKTYMDKRLQAHHDGSKLTIQASRGKRHDDWEEADERGNIKE